jgi:hypothetical protein
MDFINVYKYGLWRPEKIWGTLDLLKNSKMRL